MSDLRTWIEAQLKRGYTRQQIKNALIRKGYPPTAVAEVDKVGYSALPVKTLPNKKIDRKIPYSLILIIIAIIVGIAYFTFGGSQAKDAGIKEAAMPPIPQPESVEELCSKFEEAEYKISCSNAVALALADSPGKVQNILIGTVQVPDFSVDIPAFIEKDAWLIDIKLEKHFFNALGEEIKVLRIGIGLNEGIGISRSPLE